MGKVWTYRKIQEGIMATLRCHNYISSEANLVEAVEILIASKRPGLAIDLLIAGWEKSPLIKPEHFARRLINRLRGGRLSVGSLIRRIARDHRWEPFCPASGLNFEVYPREWFCIPEPLSQEIRASWLPRER